MFLNAMILIYAVATGFVAAGLLASLYQLMTDRPPAFAVSTENLVTGVGAIMMCAFAGPFIIMRNAIRGRLIEHRPLGWLAASAFIAAGWSLCSGILVIEFALALRDTIA
ncbi:MULTISPECIES: DUF6949 family protein [Hyphomicrobiales]|uniref:Uncharacterized protein n=2 Tax=Prosthecodimorpha TaxID=2981530 RepID=A0A0P6W944_9HYPH|nr:MULTISPECIES: hypothetical protein [Hyphomicrobiales]KPL55671.1 hypothetical protein ABB55_04600 [Prosthecomicrobium hirschii]MBT9290449.1 hypothetical protein [Prosthecodimorpha staleyi]MCW1838477.1 hypothetical protein [Prosthecomicrobium hirschii]